VFGFARGSSSDPEHAVANSGFALLSTHEYEGRRFGLTTELELVPLDQVSRVRPSEFHGVSLGGAVSLPVVFVRSRQALLYAGSPERGLAVARPLAHREALAITGKSALVGGRRYLETRAGDWLVDLDLVRIDPPEHPPTWARGGRTWIHVAITAQTLVAYVGTEPVYATLVSTGAGGLGDPEETHATPRGEFLVHTKHVTATMSGDEVGDEFDLGDVPYVQYFSAGYAFHAAYWHDGFGAPRSHGCVNLSPIDARWLFHFTDPPVPRGWHGAFSLRGGTLVSITP
jgi:lipoprotein-anchoring transpeptidase ErfK/SrfK